MAAGKHNAAAVVHGLQAWRLLLLPSIIGERAPAPCFSLSYEYRTAYYELRHTFTYGALWCSLLEPGPLRLRRARPRVVVPQLVPQLPPPRRAHM